MRYHFISDIPEIAALKVSSLRPRQLRGVKQIVKMDHITVALTDRNVVVPIGLRGVASRRINMNVVKDVEMGRYRRRRDWEGWIPDVLEAAVLFGVLPQEAFDRWNATHKRVQMENDRRREARDILKDLESLSIKAPAALRRLAEEPFESVGGRG